MHPENLKRANEIDNEIDTLNRCIKENEKHLEIKKIDELCIYYRVNKHSIDNNGLHNYDTKYFSVENKYFLAEYRNKIDKIIRLMNKKMLDMIDKLTDELRSL